jgi:nitrogenase molybdenum-iron protein beta chain
MATQLAEPDPERQPNQINVIPGWVEPSDMRALKELLAHFGVTPIMFPDLTDVTDSVPSGDHSMYPPGGVTVADLRRTGASALTLALGPTASQAAGRALKTEHGVPLEVLELPIGLRATDAVVQQLHRFSGVPVPDAIAYERARLIDMLKNMNSYLYRKRVAVTGDPDQLVSLCQFVSDAGMQPVYAVTGTPGKGVVKRIQNALGEKAGEVRIAHGAQADLFQLHQWIKQEPVDLIIGNSYCKYIARDEGIPLVRASFPIFDRVGHQYFPMFGYRGGLRLIDMILEAFQGRLDAESPEESFELVM